MRITYKLTAKSRIAVTALDLPASCSRPLGRETLCIPWTTFAGRVRQGLQARLREHTIERFATLEEVLFPERSRYLNPTDGISFSDLRCIGIQEPNDTGTVGVVDPNRILHPVIHEALHSVPPGTEFFGSVTLPPGPSGIERSIALSALAELARLGRGGVRGLGYFELQVVSRDARVVFTSYSWDDVAHLLWVRDLAVALMDHGMDVRWDQVDLLFPSARGADSFTAPSSSPLPLATIEARRRLVSAWPNAMIEELMRSASSIHEKVFKKWMRSAVANCDKVVAVLTPPYRSKAISGERGVGFEYQQLIAEREPLSVKLQRYVGILRKGELAQSMPPLLDGRPVCDLRGSTSGSMGAQRVVELLRTG